MAEVAAKNRYIKLKMVVSEERRKGVEEMDKQREEVEREIEEVDRKIMEKEEELKQLMKEVDELKNECIEDVIRSGYMDDQERAKAIKRHKEKEIKKLDLRERWIKGRRR